MRNLSTLALRAIVARPVRSALTMLAIGLGVGVLFAVLVINVSIAAGSERAVDAMLGQASLRVSAFEERGLDRASVRAVAGAPSVALAAASIDQGTYLLPTAEGGFAEPGDPVRVIGIDVATWPRIHSLALATGEPLGRGDREGALVSPAVAAQLGLEVGGRLTLLGAGEPTTLEIRGILAAETTGSDAPPRTVIVTLATAQRMFATDGVDSIDVTLATGSDPDAAAAAIEQVLVTRPYTVATRDQLVESLRSSTAEFRTVAAMVAAVVLFVAAFLIFNTLSMTVAERGREVALLRAAGATAGQAYRLVLAGAGALGVAGSVLGVGLGLVLASLASWYVRSIEGLPVDAPVVPGGTIVVALAIGFTTTVVAGIEPALRAARIRPVAALRTGADPVVAERARLRWLLVVFALIAAVAVVLVPADAGPGAVGRALAVYGLLLAAALAVPLLLGPLGRLVGLFLRPFARAEERLARGSIVRDRSRAALATGALGIGLAMVVALATVASGARATGTAWLGEVIPGDLVVTSIRPIGPDEDIEAELAAVDGVARVTPFADLDVAWRGTRLAAVATLGSYLAADGRLRFVAGDREAALTRLDEGGAVILPQSLATRLGLAVDDPMEVTTADGPLTLTVVGVVERSMPGSTGEAVIVGYGDAIARLGASGADLFAIRFDPGTGPTTGPALAEVAAAYALTPTPLDELAGAIGGALDRIIGLFDAVALLAVLVAGLGVATTFAMSVIERVPEIGVLRATGMTRRQVRRMVIVEAIMLGGVGVVVGSVAGLLAGALMLALGGARPPGVPLPDPGVLVLVVAVGLLVPVVAALSPARAAGRIPIVRAVAFR